MYIYIRNYSYLECAGIQSCPLIWKKRYIENVLFLEDFRRYNPEKFSSTKKPWAPTMDHHGFHCNRELSSISSVSFCNLNIFRRHSCRFPPFCRDNLERNAPGNVSLNLPNSYVFQSKFRFFDIDREKPWKPGEGSSIFEERYLIPLGFIAKQLFLIVLRHRSWG